MLPNSSDNELVTGINVTPMVDITLVLLIIFMVTASFVSEQALQVSLPKVERQEKAPHPALTVSLGKDGELKFNHEDLDLEGLKKQMAVESGLNPDVKVILKADKDITYEKLAAVLDAIKLGGVQKIALAMDRK